MKASRLWSLWQALVVSCALGFTNAGLGRFVEWCTGLALNVEEHTITQSLLALGRAADWKALESFAEYGSWSLPLLEMGTAEASAAPADRLWHGYHVWVGDDTKVHRGSAHVWGTCTFHEYTARCPNRASTVRAHNWVVTGALRHHPGQPATFLPVAGRLYFRKSQLPFAKGDSGQRLPFRTKPQLMVELARQNASTLAGKHLLVVDGGFALRSVVRPLAWPEQDEQGDPPRVEVITRLRHDARLHAPPEPRKGPRPGAPPKWGRRLAPPRQGGRWPGPWQVGEAFLYGRVRRVEWKEVLCQWRALGHDVLVKVVVAKVEGYKKRFVLLSTATELSGLQIVELFCARFRQEDGFRDLKQRLGWEECRAWTRAPIERTTQALFVTMSCLRLLEEELETEEGDGWWFHPPWNKRKERPSVLDLGRLLRQHGGEIQRLLANWLEKGETAVA
jgi:DDE superfamily endonuclease